MKPVSQSVPRDQPSEKWFLWPLVLPRSISLDRLLLESESLLPRSRRGGRSGDCRERLDWPSRVRRRFPRGERLRSRLLTSLKNAVARVLTLCSRIVQPRTSSVWTTLSRRFAILRTFSFMSSGDLHSITRAAPTSSLGR
jgi:hypothetical protein